VLTPANRQLVTVTIGVSAFDGCGAAVHCRIASVTSDEPVDGQDWIVTGGPTLQLRADGEGDGPR
jgi:hypothetical protein